MKVRFVIFVVAGSRSCLSEINFGSEQEDWEAVDCRLPVGFRWLLGCCCCCHWFYWCWPMGLFCHQISLSGLPHFSEPLHFSDSKSYHSSENKMSVTAFPNGIWMTLFQTNFIFAIMEYPNWDCTYKFTFCISDYLNNYGKPKSSPFSKKRLDHIEKALKIQVEDDPGSSILFL